MEPSSEKCEGTCSCCGTIRDALTEETPKNGFLQEMLEWSQAIAMAVVLALLINQFVFAMVQVEGSSMQPTLQSKERLVITKLFYQPKAKDIVVVKAHTLGKHIIKRIIAVPGDVIDINQITGDVIVNGEVQNEPYIMEKLRYAGTACNYPLTVPEGYVFVMGDNRNNSQDSRNLGLVAFEDIVGRASLRVTPFLKFGTLYNNVES
ncbi:MAG: signal peptidase I [Ruminococcaceae bacterium]|nr:signal peptidase I [Oscillospiraceae bacterium]